MYFIFRFSRRTLIARTEYFYAGTRARGGIGLALILSFVYPEYRNVTSLVNKEWQVRIGQQGSIWTCSLCSIKMSISIIELSMVRPSTPGSPGHDRADWEADKLVSGVESARQI